MERLTQDQQVSTPRESSKQTFWNTTIAIFSKILLYILSLLRKPIKDDLPEGDGFRFMTKPSPHVLIQSQRLCREVFLGNSFRRPKSLGLGNLFERWLGDCLGCLDTDNPAWAGLKRVFVPLFRTSELDDESLIREWDKEIRHLYEKSRATERPIPIDDVVADLPLKFILRKIFGVTFLEQYNKEFEAIQENAAFLMFKVFNEDLAKWKFYQFLPTQTNTALSNFERKWSRLLQLAERAESVRNEGIYMELVKNYQHEKRIISYKMFSQTLAEVVYANKDVVLPSAAWLLTHYALYPNITNTSHFIEESARLCPVFPTSMAKVTTRDITIENSVIIPKGTSVLMDNVALGQSPDWKMDDLNVFRQERHSNPAMHALITRFGYGGRKCPGGRIANHLFARMLEHLKQNWSLMPSHPTKPDSIQKDPSRPFTTPLFDVWILPKQSSCLPHPNTLYYDCPPTAESKEKAFMAISINPRSPFLTDQKRVDMAVKLLADRAEESVILLADDIARFNIQAFQHKKPEIARTKAKELGDKFAEIFTKSITEFGRGRVSLCRWTDLNLPENIDQSLLIHEELVSRVNSIAKKYVDCRGQGKIDSSYEERIKLGARYILSEIPVLICGIRYQATWYRLLYYCGSLDHLSQFAEAKDSLHNLVLDILTKPEFSKIREEISDLVGSRNLYKVPGFIGVDISKAI